MQFLRYHSCAGPQNELMRGVRVGPGLQAYNIAYRLWKLYSSSPPPTETVSPIETYHTCSIFLNIITTFNAAYNTMSAPLEADSLRERELSKLETAGSVVMTKELFEKLYLSPHTNVAGNLRKTFANPTPL